MAQGAFFSACLGSFYFGMRIHGSCGSRGGSGVLLIGPPGSGKSDLLLRLLDHGFALVADDQVVIENGIARAPVALAGMLEVRGLGILRLAHVHEARLELLVELAATVDRLPEPTRDAVFNLPRMRVNAWQVSAAAIVAVALDCALGRVLQHAGAITPTMGVPPS